LPSKLQTVHHNKLLLFWAPTCLGIIVTPLKSTVQGKKVCRYNWHNAGSQGWPIPMLKYQYIIFEIKYTEAIISNSTQKLLRFEIEYVLAKCRLQFKTNKFIVLFVIIIGTLSFPIAVYFRAPRAHSQKLWWGALQCFSPMPLRIPVTPLSAGLDFQDGGRLPCWNVSAGWSACFGWCGREYRKRANVLVQSGAKQLTADWLRERTGRVTHHVLHVDLPNAHTHTHTDGHA